MKNKPVLSHLWVFLGLAAYLVLFFAARLPSLEGQTGDVFRRYQLSVWMLLPEQLLELWCGAPPEFALFDRVPVVAIAGVILGSAAAVGWLLMRGLGIDRGLTRLEVFVFSTAVGLNVLSTYTLLVGLLGMLRSRLLLVGPVAVTLAAGAAMIGWVWFKRGRVPWLGQETGHSRVETGHSRVETGHRRVETGHSGVETGQGRGSDGLLSRHWLWLAVPFVVVTLLGGLLPPIEFDVREYHLQVPKEFFGQGYVGFLPHNVYGNMPMGTEMLSLLAMALAGDWWLGALAGKTVIAAFAPLTALGLLAAGRRLVSPTAGVVAAVVYVSIPWIGQVSNLGLVEGASACYLFLAAYALMLERRSGVERSAEKAGGVGGPSEKTDLSRFLLAGYLAGGAVACKYPAVLFVVTPLAVWILVHRNRELAACLLLRRKKQAAKPVPERRLATRFLPVGAFLLAVAVGSGAWFGKNWAFTGNPTYPLLYGVFGDRTGTWTPEKDRQWNGVHRPTDFSPRTLAKDTLRVALASEWLSPLVFPLAALAFLAPARRRAALVLVAYFGFVIALWWLLTHRIDRFWIPTLPLLAFLAGVGACWSRERIWRRTVVALLILGCGFNLLVVTTVGGGYTRYFVGLARLRSHQDEERVDPYHLYFNAHASDGRVLSVGDAQVFDLEMPVFYNTCFDDSLFEEIVAGRKADEIRRELTARRISHVYVHWGEIARYRSSGNYGYTDFVQPAVFERLVERGVLEMLPEEEVLPERMKGHPGRAYRVVSEGR